MFDSTKKLQVSVSSLFQVALLIVLVVICAGIWKNRYFGPIVANDADDTPHFVTAGDQPVPSVPTNIIDPKELLPSIKNGDGRAIQAGCVEARRTGNMQFVMQVFLLVCEHGNQQAMQGLIPLGSLVSANDLADFYKGITILLDRKEYECVRFVVSQPLTMSLLSRGFMELIEKEFARSPWDAVRFEALINSLRLSSDQLGKLAKASINGPPERFDWIMNNIERLIPSSHSGFSVQLRASEINDATVERVLRLGALMQTDKQLLFVDCLPYIKSDHFDYVKSMLRSRGGYHEQSPLMDYLLKQDTNKVFDWLESDKLLRDVFVSRFKNAINSTQSEVELEKYAPFSNLLGRLAQIGGENDFYSYSSLNNPDKVTWLWKHGILPKLPQYAEIALFLAVDNRDIELLKESLKHSNVKSSLTNGVSVVTKASTNPVWKESENHALLVAIKTWNLEAVKVIIESGLLDWKECRHGLLLSALQANRKDMYKYLVDKGVEWKSNDIEVLKKSTAIDLDKEILEIAFKGRWHDSVEFASAKVLNAVKAGDYDLLDRTLLNFPFRSDDPVVQANSLETFRYTLMEYETKNMYWLNQNVREAMLQSIRHPKLFARLLAEGCPVDIRTLTEIKKSGNLEVLEMAFSDLAVRELAERNNFSFLFDGSVSPQAIQLLKDMGVR